MKKVLFFTLLFSLVFVGGVYAQGKSSKDAGITPDSPLYIIDIATESIQELLTLNPDAKVLRKVENAAERLAEMEAMASENNPKAVERAQENFEKKVNQAIKIIEKQKAKGRDVSDLVEEVINNLGDQLEVAESIPPPEVLQADALTAPEIVVINIIDESINELENLALVADFEPQNTNDNLESTIGEILEEETQVGLTPEFCDDFALKDSCLAVGCLWGTGG